MTRASNAGVVSALASLLVLIAADRNPISTTLMARQGPAPGTPTNVVAIVSGGTLTTSWTAPAAGATPTGYRLDFYSGNTLVASVNAGPATSVVVGIPPGTQGTFSVTVTAIASGTSGAPSAPATFTIGGGCTGPPPTPTGLTGTLSGGNAQVQWNPAAGASSYLFQAGSTPGASNLFNANVGNMTMVSGSGLPPGFSAHLRVFSVGPCGTSAPTADFFLTASSTGCVAGPGTVCAFNRFKIEATFRNSTGASGPALVAPGGRYDDGAYFYFTNPAQQDLLVQILNRCSSNNRFWVFASGNTNVELTITVTDTQRGGTKQYSNPLGRQFPPVQDTDAFATCP